MNKRAKLLKVLLELYGPNVVYEIVYGLPPLRSETVEMELP